MTPLIMHQAFQCNRCDHVWISKKYDHNNPPLSCAKCKSVYWNKDPINNTITRPKVVNVPTAKQLQQKRRKHSSTKK